MMTMEQRFWSMKGSELIKEAEKLGVKVAHTGDKLKESKEKAIRKMLAVMSTETAEVEEVAEVAVEEVAEATETVKERKARKRIKKTFEELVADIPSVGNIQFVRNRKNEVLVKRDKKQIFRYTGPRVVCIRKEHVDGLNYRETKYGFVVEPTVENMRSIFANALA